jgi:O-antigen ligase
MLVASLPVSLSALMQQFDIGPTRSVLATLTGTDIYATTVDNVFGFQEATARATGPFPHWHDLGGYLMIIVLLGFGLLVEGSRWVLPRWVIVAIMVPAAAALVQTVSAAPLLGTAVGVVVIGMWAGRQRSVLAWTLVGAAVVSLAFSPLLERRIDQQLVAPPGAQSSLVPQTLAYRYSVWQQFIPVLDGRLLTGYGPDLPPGLAFQHADSIYLELLLRGGMPLLVIYLALIWALAARALRTTRARDPDTRVVGRVVMTVIIVLVPIHLIQTYFLDTGPPHLLWALAGLLVLDPGGNDPPAARGR